MVRSSRQWRVQIYVFYVGIHFYFFRFMICTHLGAVLAFVVSAF